MSTFKHQTIGECLYSTGFGVKQPDNVVLLGFEIVTCVICSAVLADICAVFANRALFFECSAPWK